MKIHSYTSTPTGIWINSVGLYDILSMSDIIICIFIPYFIIPPLRFWGWAATSDEKLVLKICFSKITFTSYNILKVHCRDRDFRLVYKYRWNNTELCNTVLIYYWICQWSTTSIQYKLIKFLPYICPHFEYIGHIKPKSIQRHKNKIGQRILWHD